MLRTPLCDLLNIAVPVICAPMGPHIIGPELAAAVSNAGGLGIISFGGYPAAAHPVINQVVGDAPRLAGRGGELPYLVGRVRRVILRREEGAVAAREPLHLPDGEPGQFGLSLAK